MSELWSWFVTAPDYFNHSPYFPNPVVCMRDMAKMGVTQGYSRFFQTPPRVFVQETLDWIRLSVYLDWQILLLPFAVAVALTVLRVVLNFLLFRRIPVWAKLPAEEADKLPESMWKCSVYMVTWSWAVYLVLFGEQNLFTNLVAHWELWRPGYPLDPLLYWLYVFELGFYIHCIYATIYIETIRRDFVVLMLHHFLTISLLLFSYAVRFHLIGLLLLFILDFGDIWLELSKTLVYFKVRDGKEHFGPEMAANCTFAVFTVQHVLFRLYWFPTKVIYSAMYVALVYYPSGPYWALFVVMLWSLYAMQAYWFTFIVKLIFKILRNEPLEDNREYSEKPKVNGSTDANCQENGDTHQTRETSEPSDTNARKEPDVDTQRKQEID